ncbi:hypothetical protein GCM10018966_066240 [Streptomyces yanii]
MPAVCGWWIGTGPAASAGKRGAELLYRVGGLKRWARNQPRAAVGISGNMRRPRRYRRRLMRVFYMPAQVAAQHCPFQRRSTNERGPRQRPTSKLSSPSRAVG